jgi:hypothetical protein
MGAMLMNFSGMAFIPHGQNDANIQNTVIVEYYFLEYDTV